AFARRKSHQEPADIPQARVFKEADHHIPLRFHPDAIAREPAHVDRPAPVRANRDGSDRRGSKLECELKSARRIITRELDPRRRDGQREWWRAPGGRERESQEYQKRGTQPVTASTDRFSVPGPSCRTDLLCSHLTRAAPPRAPSGRGRRTGAG